MRSDHDGVLARLLPASATGDRSREWFTIIGGIGILVFLLIGAFGPMIAPYPAEEMVGPPFQEPSEDHLLGTDDMGHDILSQLLVGARVSMFVGVVAGTLAVLAGTVVGVTAGVLGGRVETVLMRFIDVVLTIPFLPLIIVVAAVMGQGLWTTIGVLSVVMWARPARELRSEVLSVRSREYIEASRSMGGSAIHVAVRYVVPAVLLIVIAQFARVVSMAILLEAALSFLGLGDPTRPSWGTTLFYAQQRSAFLTGAWKWWVIPPGLAITLSVLSFVFVTLGVERRSGPDRRSIATRVPGADIEMVSAGSGPGEPGRDVVTSDGGQVDAGLAEDDRAGVGAGRSPVLSVSDLTVAYGPGPEDVAVDDADLTLRDDEVLGIVGESGSGKSSFALALLDLLREPGRVTDGRVTLYTDRDYDRDAGLADIRGDEIAYVPQEAMNALDPRLRLEDQLVEVVRVHRNVSERDATAVARETLERVGLPPESHDRYPFELSGGMRQRGVVAMALVNDPSVLVVDEPTTGLDTVTKLSMLDLVEDLQAERELSVILITHDLPAVTRVADRIAVMREGRFVEVGETDRLRSAPDHPYTAELLGARTALPEVGESVPAGIRPPSSAADPSSASSTGGAGEAEDEPHLAYEDVGKSFGDERVLDGVDLAVPCGRAVALLGESGAGKSTMGRMALGLVSPDRGAVTVDGEPVGRWRARDAEGLGREVHYLFQDAYSSLAPTRRVEAIVREPLEIHDVGTEDERADEVRRRLREVGLDPADEYARRYPGELSGGERQRVAFARALVLEPAAIVADEPTSMLDAPRQRDLLELLYELVVDRGITLVHITHDVAQAATFADEIAVLHDGRIVEHESVATIVGDPTHEQTRTLVEAAAALSEPAADDPADRPPANGDDDE